MLVLPQGTDKLNNPSHSRMHRVIAVNDDSPEQSIIIDSTGNIIIDKEVRAASIDKLAIAYAIALG